MSLSSRPLLAAAAALALCAALPALAQDQTAPAAGTAADGTAAAETAPAAEAPELTGDTVIATVGDYSLTLGELVAVRQALPEQYQSLPPEVLLAGLTEQLVNQTILAQMARADGLDTRRDVALSLRNLVSSLLAETWLREQIGARIGADAIEAAYEAQYVKAEPVEEVRAAHILVESEEAAKDLRAQIAAGAAFADLAREHGTDGTAQRGGDLGWFVKADMVPEFAEAAFALETGTVSDPVQSPFGWHLIQLNERRARPVPPLDAVRDEIVQTLARAAQEAVLAEAKAAVPVTRSEIEIPPAAILDDSLTAAE